MAGKSGESRPIKINICPFCGFRDDRETALSYPSEFNYCYHTKPVDPISIAHQNQFCLNSNFMECPVFKNEKIIKMPHEYKGTNPNKPQPRLWKWLVLSVIIVFIGIIIINSYGLISLPLSTFAQKGSPTATVTETTIPPTSTTVMETSTATPTIEPSLTFTPQQPTIVSPHLLETAFGSAPQLVIHRIQEGEGFILLASTYKTSVEAIKAINYAISDTLLVNKIIVIPMNTLDVKSLPPFSTYEVITGGITIEELATKLKIGVENFRKYNDLPIGYRLSTGEWLLIPH